MTKEIDWNDYHVHLSVQPHSRFQQQTKEIPFFCLNEADDVTIQEVNDDSTQEEDGGFEFSEEFVAFLLKSRQLREEREQAKAKAMADRKKQEEDEENEEQMQLLHQEKERFGEYFGEFCRLRAEVDNTYSQKLDTLKPPRVKDISWWPNVPINM